MIKKGSSVSFSISYFHMCLANPTGNYRIIVALDSQAPPDTVDSGVSVPIGHLEGSPALCLPSGIGEVSPLSISTPK
jgi:hypothetical protein